MKNIQHTESGFEFSKTPSLPRQHKPYHWVFSYKPSTVGPTPVKYLKLSQALFKPREEGEDQAALCTAGTSRLFCSYFRGRLASVTAAYDVFDFPSQLFFKDLQVGSAFSQM